MSFWTGASKAFTDSYNAASERAQRQREFDAVNKRADERWALDKASLEDDAVARKRSQGIQQEVDSEFARQVGTQDQPIIPQVKLGLGNQQPGTNIGLGYQPDAGDQSGSLGANVIQRPGIKGQPGLQGRDLENSMLRVAQLKQDSQGIRDAKGRLDTLDEGEIIATVNKMPPKEVQAWAHGLNGASRSTLPVFYAGEGKNGMQRLLFKRPDGSAFTLEMNDAQLRTLAAADALGQDPRFATKALSMAAGVHKELEGLVKDYNVQTTNAVNTNNAGAYHSGMLDYHQGQLEISRSKAQQDRDDRKKPDWVPVGMGDGSMGFYDRRSSGAPQISEAPLPPGMRTTKMTEADKLRMAAYQKELATVDPSMAGKDVTRYNNTIRAIQDKYGIDPAAGGFKPVGPGWQQAATQAPAKAPQAQSPARPQGLERPASLRQTSEALMRGQTSQRASDVLRQGAGQGLGLQGYGLTEDDLNGLQYLSR